MAHELGVVLAVARLHAVGADGVALGRLARLATVNGDSVVKVHIAKSLNETRTGKSRASGTRCSSRCGTGTGRGSPPSLRHSDCRTRSCH